jgi:hypothetical protein
MPFYKNWHAPSIPWHGSNNLHLIMWMAFSMFWWLMDCERLVRYLLEGAIDFECNVVVRSSCKALLFVQQKCSSSLVSWMRVVVYVTHCQKEVARFNVEPQDLDPVILIACGHSQDVHAWMFLPSSISTKSLSLSLNGKGKYERNYIIQINESLTELFASCENRHVIKISNALQHLSLLPSQCQDPKPTHAPFNRFYVYTMGDSTYILERVQSSNSKNT